MFTSRHLGPLATDYTEAALPHAGEMVRVDVNLTAPAALADAAVDELDRAIDALARHEATARAAFAAVMADDRSQPAQFWQFHREEVEGLGELSRDTFVAGLRLVRAGFYPDGAYGSASYVVLDFAVRGPQTDQLLVAKLNRDGSLRTIAWES